MAEVFFYHLTSSPLEQTLPMLLGKARGAGWRVCVRGNTRERLAWLDEKLWLAEGFLPHGCVGTRFDADQPILLTDIREMPNEPQCLISIDGAEIEGNEVKNLERAMILFDGNDGEAVDQARKQWTTLTGDGCAAKYWAQDGGRWIMKSENPAAS